MRANINIPFRSPELIGEHDPSDFATPEGLRAVIARLQKTTSGIFRIQNKIDLTFVVFSTWNPADKEPANYVTVTVMDNPDYSGANKSLTTNFVASLAKASRAVAVATAGESWSARISPEEYDEWHKTHDSLEHHPKCEEKLFLTLECERYTSMWQAPIAELADPLASSAVTRRTLGEWSELPRSYHLEGRFAGLLKPAAARGN